MNTMSRHQGARSSMLYYNKDFKLGGHQLVYRFPKPQPDGSTQLRLTPLQLIERLTTLIPPSRQHRHRHHGVLAPNAPQRAQVTALARQPILPAPAPNAATSHAPAPRSSARYLWTTSRDPKTTTLNWLH
jgi:hypothetical protein